MTQRTASIIGGIGRTLIALGLMTLSFAAFQLWGTGLQESRAQESLETDFEARLAEVTERAAELGIPEATTSSATTTPESAPDQEATGQPDPDDPDQADTDNPVMAAAEPNGAINPELAELMRVEQGTVMGNINIPAIGLQRHMIEGVERGNLREGPGHYPTSPLPGQAGNAAIAGHRTTYGSPFGDLDLLVPGDEIVVTTLQGEFRYQVMGYPGEDGEEVGHFIVRPDQVEILQDYGDNRLTLTACNPKYSARERIVVTALLVEEPAPALPTTIPDPAELAEQSSDPATDELALDEGNVIGISDNALDESLGWNYEERTPTILWGAVTALIALIAIVVARLWKRLPAYLMATPGFLIALFICFTHLDRLLPAL